MYREREKKKLVKGFRFADWIRRFSAEKISINSIKSNAIVYNVTWWYNLKYVVFFISLTHTHIHTNSKNIVIKGKERLIESAYTCFSNVLPWFGKLKSSQWSELNAF